MSTLGEAAAACCACIRVRWLETRHPAGEVSGRWVCSTCEREFEPREVAYGRGVQEGTRAQTSAILYTVGGTVEGHPTSSINFLQRLRQLVKIEKAAREIADWHAVQGETGFVSADHLDALADALEGPPVEDPYVLSLRADFARDQAELASMRITVAETKADLEQAAKVTEELVDGLSEEARKRNVAEVELERLTEERDAARAETKRRTAELLKGDIERLAKTREADRLREALTRIIVAEQSLTVGGWDQAVAALANTSEPAPAKLGGYCGLCGGGGTSEMASWPGCQRCQGKGIPTSEPAPCASCVRLREALEYVRDFSRSLRPEIFIERAVSRAEGALAAASEEPVKCATFAPGTIPADVRAKMDADRKAAEERGVAGDRCEVGNNCGRAGCPECQK